MTYDPACGDLARYFLGDNVSEQSLASLAETIQKAIEDWFVSTEAQPK